jgi:hypothetical protein
VEKECIDGSKYAPYSMDEYSKWHEMATIKRKDKVTHIRWFMALVRRIQRVYNADVVAIRYDNEKGFGNDLINTTEEPQLAQRSRMDSLSAQAESSLSELVLCVYTPICQRTYRTRCIALPRMSSIAHLPKH